jgi:hypothetical protein
MQALVVYESHFGNTAAVAQAIADGIGGGTRAVATGEAHGRALEGLDLLVAGSPVHQFGLPSQRSLAGMGDRPGPEPDLSQPPLRDWLGDLPAGQGRAVAFETRLRWSPGGAGGAIERGLEQAGYEVVARPGRFIVTGYYGPLRDGELERAKAWGAQIAALVSARLEPVGALPG